MSREKMIAGRKDLQMATRLVGRVMWVGRATVFLVGLAVILALVLGLATTALGATGGQFILGQPNDADKPTLLSSTLSRAAQSGLVVVNKGTGSALHLRVTNTDSPPMKVNSSATVANFSADRLDGKDSTDFAPKVVEGWHEVGATNEPQFTNGWTNYSVDFSTAAFYKDPWGVVHLKGRVSGGTVAHGGSGVIFKLPCGYGPSRDELHSVLSNDAVGRVTIGYDIEGCSSGQSSGYVVAAPPSNSASVSLDGITFRAAGS